MILKVFWKTPGISGKKKYNKDTTEKKLRLCAVYLPRSFLLFQEKTRKETLQFQQPMRKTRKKMLVWQTSEMGWLHQDLNWVLAPSPGLGLECRKSCHVFAERIELCKFYLNKTSPPLKQRRVVLDIALIIGHEIREGPRDPAFVWPVSRVKGRSMG